MLLTGPPLMPFSFLGVLDALEAHCYHFIS